MINDQGTFLLNARGITPIEGAGKRAKDLLTLPKEHLQALAWRALAGRVLGIPSIHDTEIPGEHTPTLHRL